MVIKYHYYSGIHLLYKNIFFWKIYIFLNEHFFWKIIIIVSSQNINSAVNRQWYEVYIYENIIKIQKYFFLKK